MSELFRIDFGSGDIYKYSEEHKAYLLEGHVDAMNHDVSKYVGVLNSLDEDEKAEMATRLAINAYDEDDDFSTTEEQVDYHLERLLDEKADFDYLEAKKIALASLSKDA